VKDSDFGLLGESGFGLVVKTV